jgi:hypothetical protein
MSITLACSLWLRSQCPSASRNSADPSFWGDPLSWHKGIRFGRRLRVLEQSYRDTERALTQSKWRRNIPRA